MKWIFAGLCAAAVAAVWYVAIATARLEDAGAAAARDLPIELRETVQMEAAVTRVQIAREMDQVLTRVDRAVILASKTEGDANAQLSGLRVDLAGISDRLAATVDRQGDRANATLAAALNGDRGLVPAATAFLATYRRIPDQLAGSAAWQSLEPEIVCRHADGTGYGGCMRARVNGMLGEWERTGAQITKYSPQFIGAASGIAVDVHTFTSKAVTPPTIKGRIYDGVKLGAYIAGRMIP